MTIYRARDFHNVKTEALNMCQMFVCINQITWSLQDLRFPQWCCWGFRVSWMCRFVVWLVFPLISDECSVPSCSMGWGVKDKTPYYFKTAENADIAIQHQHPRSPESYVKFVLPATHVAMLNWFMCGTLAMLLYPECGWQDVCRQHWYIWRSWDRATLMYYFKYNQQDATLYNILYYCQCCTCFRRFLRPSSGAQKLYTQHLVYVSKLDIYQVLCV